MGDVRLDGGSVEARNNIFAGLQSIVADKQLNNLFSYTKVKFIQFTNKESKPSFIPENITASMEE